MKQQFLRAWKQSVQPRKQRKYRAEAPLHLRGRFLGAHLAQELRKKTGVRALRVRKGDSVTIMRGQFRKKEGKVERVDTRKCKVFVHGAEVVKRDGTKAMVPIDPSNLLITKLSEDPRRMAVKKG
ncbi:50S ribosomal protein L24 [Candidatus Woesearchaeota archaeon]|nr:50S ribosomal protein L24 [Candidatus Woesearchaeota archaeon]